MSQKATQTKTSYSKSLETALSYLFVLMEITANPSNWSLQRRLLREQIPHAASWTCFWHIAYGQVWDCSAGSGWGSFPQPSGPRQDFGCVLGFEHSWQFLLVGLRWKNRQLETAQGTQIFAWAECELVGYRWKINSLNNPSELPNLNITAAK